MDKVKLRVELKSVMTKLVCLTTKQSCLWLYMMPFSVCLGWDFL